MNKPLLSVKNLTIRFGSTEVVHGISFDIAAGEKFALVGESGSGKTVTALSLLRLAQNAQLGGSVEFFPAESASDGHSLLSISEQALRNIRGQDISFIFQEPMTALNPLMTIGKQIAEVLELKQGLVGAGAAQAAIKLLADTGIPEPERRADSFPHQLSGGQRQRAMIAMALACKPKLLLADEPTTALDVTLREQILDLLGDLQREYGMAMLLITHDLKLVRRFADRVAVMENGHLVEQGAVAEVFANPQHAYTRKLIASKPVRDVVEIVNEADAPATVRPEPVEGQRPPKPRPNGSELLYARGLRVTYPVNLPGLRGWLKQGEFVAVQGANFHLPPGQTLGVIGESGSGKSTLAQAVLGLLPFAGEFQVAGQSWSKKSAANKALRKRIQVVFQDPFSSLSPRMTLEEIVGEGIYVHEPSLVKALRRERVLAALADVGMQEAHFPGLLQRYPHEFSGGQRQRIAIARALIVNPEVLVLDEPTSALDVTIQQQVLQLLQGLQKTRGLSYLLITHDVDVIRAMAHHVLVMKDGHVLESGTVDVVLKHPKDPYTQGLVSHAEPIRP